MSELSTPKGVAWETRTVPLAVGATPRRVLLLDGVLYLLQSVRTDAGQERGKLVAYDLA